MWKIPEKLPLLIQMSLHEILYFPVFEWDALMSLLYHNREGVLP